MTNNGTSHLQKLGEAYIKNGYPNHQVWYFSTPATDEEGTLALRELAAHQYIEPFAGNWRLTTSGLNWILSAHPITEGAKHMLRELGEMYRKNGYPNRLGWYFSSPDKEDVATVQELSSRGFIEPFAGSWRLTDFGQRAILKSS